MNKILNKSRGQIAVLYAGILVVLVGAIALGADVSVMYVNWQQAQKVADAAAIAGANYLNGGITYSDPATGTPYTTSTGCAGETSGSSPEDVATQVACTYVVKNGLDPSTITITPTATTIQVLVQEPALPYFFGKALGLSTYAVAATATAAGGGTVNTVLGSNTTSMSTSSSLGLFPIGLQCKKPCAAGSLVAGEPLSFGTKFISATVNAPGNWDWLGPDGIGTAQIGGDITHGANAAFEVSPTGSCGTDSATGASYCITTAPGNKAPGGPINKALSDRLASCPSLSVDPCADGGNPNDIPAGDPCLVIMPAVDFTGVTGSKNIPIESFAEVYLESDSSPTNLDGCFISTVAGGTLAITTTTTTTGGTTSTTSLGAVAPSTLVN